MKKYRAYYLLVFAIFLLIINPQLWSGGMFMDGLLYADISLNLSEHIGSIWDLKLTETLYPHFHEHPPMAFALQSLFFSLLGNGLWVERLYSLFTFIINALLIIKIWRIISPPKYHQYGFFPFFLYSSIPVISWSFSNNMLENTMSVFTLLSLLFLILSTKRRHTINILFSALSLLLAFLSKGFVSLYPLSFFFWLMLFKPNYSLKQSIKDSSLLSLSLGLSLVLLFILFPDSKNSLELYIQKQVVGSIQNISTVSNRFFIIRRCFNELIPAFIIIGILLASTYKKEKITIDYWAKTLILVSVSGIIPITISMKQSGFYILSVYPIIALSLALISIKPLHFVFRKITSKTQFYINIVSITLFILSCVSAVYYSQKVGRDKEMIADIKQILPHIPKGTTISMPQNLRTKWSLHGYFYRYKQISLDSDTNIQHPYYLNPISNTTFSQKNYKKISKNTKLYNIYKQQNNDNTYKECSDN